MLESILLILFFGFVLSANVKFGSGNPYVLYFGMWLVIFFIYYMNSDTYIKISNETLLLLLCSKTLAVLILLQDLLFKKKSFLIVCNKTALCLNEKTLDLLQVLTFFLVPFAYLKAVEIAYGNDIFTASGFVQLRSSMTDDGLTLGIFSYVSLLSFVVVSLRAFTVGTQNGSVLKLSASVLVALFYLYISTGRTFVLLLMLMCVAPLYVVNKIGLKGLVVSILILLSLFTLVALLTGKGLSPDAPLLVNIDNFLVNLRGYITAPLVALSVVVDNNSPIFFGEHSFRSIISTLNYFGFLESGPLPLIREYSAVPDLTNVYTVYEVYFLDFFLFGFFIPPLFLILHAWLFRSAKSVEYRSLFIYAASLYPLLMQFFQDQYFTLLSMWLQIVFWYCLLIRPTSLSKPLREKY